MDSFENKYFDLVDASNGKIIANGLQKENLKIFSKLPFLGNRSMPKIDVKKIRQSSVSRASMLFFIELVEYASRNNQLRDSEKKPLLDNYVAISAQLRANSKTISRHFKALKDLDMIRSYDGLLYMNPQYSVKFSMSNPSQQIATVFPESFVEAHFVQYSD